MSTALPIGQTKVRRLGFASLGIGCLTLVICVAGALLGAHAPFFRAYLAAYTFYLGIALGGMAILMVYHLTGGAWGFLIRSILEAQTRTIPLIVVLFIPVALGLEPLYAWARPEMVNEDPQIKHQQFYLNKTFFLERAVIYLAIWLLTALCLGWLSRRQARVGGPRWPWRLQRASEVGLVVFGTTLHFAAFDWMESLQPSFHSTIFPLMVATAQLLSAQAFAIVILAWLVSTARSGHDLPDMPTQSSGHGTPSDDVSPPARELGEILSHRALNDLATILFAFVILWAYMSWFQFMLIWIANQPTDVLWYVPRSRDGWQWVGGALLFGNFVIPFLLLLLRPIKENLKALARVAGLLLCMQLVFAYYQIMPAFDAPSLAEHWMDFLMPIGLGGIWFAYFLFQLQGRPLLTANDPSQESALHLRSLDDEEIELEKSLAPS
jgi:hypothetical protein